MDEIIRRVETELARTSRSLDADYPSKGGYRHSTRLMELSQALLALRQAQYWGETYKQQQGEQDGS